MSDVPVEKLRADWSSPRWKDFVAKICIRYPQAKGSDAVLVWRGFQALGWRIPFDLIKAMLDGGLPTFETLTRRRRELATDSGYGGWVDEAGKIFPPSFFKARASTECKRGKRREVLKAYYGRERSVRGLGYWSEE